MFRRSTLQLLVVVFVLALVLRVPLLALASVLLLLTAGVAWLWNRYSIVRLSYNQSFATARAFPGDEIELIISIANRKLLPLAQVEVRDTIPAGLEAEDPDITYDRADRQMLQRSTSLRWYERVTWRYTVRCQRRGAYRIGPATIDTGDPFGFYRSTLPAEFSGTLVVFPPLLPLEQLGLPARSPIGSLRARQLIRDPLRTVGVRDYHTDDPIKDVHWAATARTGTLQTRIYEPTTARELAIVLDLDSFEQYTQGIDELQIERSISAAATLAKAGLDEGYAVGLYVNGAPAYHESLVRLPPSRSPAQLERIMDVLARLTPFSVTQVARVLRMAAADLPWSTTILLLSVIQPQSSRAELARLRQRGRAVSWLYLGEDAPPVVPGMQIHHAPPAKDFRAVRQTWARSEHTINRSTE